MRLGRGRRGKDPCCSLALSANPGGSWLRETYAPRSTQPRLRALGSALRLPGCPLASLPPAALQDKRRAGRARASSAAQGGSGRTTGTGSRALSLRPSLALSSAAGDLWRRGSWRRPDCADPRRGQESRRRQGAVNEEEQSRF